MITVAADQYLFQLEDYLPPSVLLNPYDPANGLPNLKDVNALLIRTVNSINTVTMPVIPDSLTFIGTGSSGTDHIDQNYLKNNRITFADAAGCNARSVAEYITTALLLWSDQTDSILEELTVGIVGVGHAGRQVQQQLERLNISTVCYDPPRGEREAAFNSASLHEVLRADILTFHTPLTTSGNYPTFHWLDEKKLSSFSFQLIINAARGGVVDEKALIKAFEDGKVGNYILDVWEDEPDIRLATAQQAFLKTPHIAGYSVQAKQNASKFIADALIKHFDLSSPPSASNEEIQNFRKNIDHYRDLSGLLTQLQPIRKYESKLQNILNKYPQKRAKKFNKLRAQFPLRKEFDHIRLPKSYFDRFPILKLLGFGLSVKK